MNFQREVIFSIGGGKASGKSHGVFAKGGGGKASGKSHGVFAKGGGDETPSWAYVLPAEWQRASDVKLKSDVKPKVKLDAKPGDKGFAINYQTGKSEGGRVVALTASDCALVAFFGSDAAAQHTRLKDITGLKPCESSKPKVPVLPPPKESFVQGDKVWALERGKGIMPGRVIEVFDAHQSALVKFFHETGFPSQNTFFKDMSKVKPK